MKRKLNVQGVLKLVIMLVLIGGCFAVGYFMVSDRAIFAQEIDDRQKKIDALEKSSKEATAVPSSGEDLTKTISDTIKAATVAGDKVASLQTEYTGLILDTANASSDESKSRRAEISKEIASYFNADSAAKGTWYTGEGTWSFETNYKSNGNTVESIWVCRKDSELLSYATAIYNGADGTFSDLTISNTLSGNKQMMSTGQEANPDYVDAGQDPDAYAKQIMDELDVLSSSNEQREFTEEEQEEIRAAGDARDALRQQLESEQGN